ncbi:hypothetical protein NL676_036486 [Syzygium grande]|nr:hypothetical protein NL676_036486 [Syzygium grande]
MESKLKDLSPTALPHPPPPPTRTIFPSSSQSLRLRPLMDRSKLLLRDNLLLGIAMARLVLVHVVEALRCWWRTT